MPCQIAAAVAASKAQPVGTLVALKTLAPAGRTWLTVCRPLDSNEGIFINP